jgi:O-antigen/teichoic acid export membrane protein
MRSGLKDFLVTHHKGLKTKGSFTQNLAITFSGNITAQILGLLFTPFLARIYGPEAYGVFALLMAVVNNLSQVSTLQFPSGYVAAKTDEEFFGIVKITSTFLFLFTAVCSVALWTYESSITTFFNLTELQPYLIWIPIYLIFMGMDSILMGWNIRIKEFKRNAVAKIVSTVISKSISLIIGIFYLPNAAGIIFGNLLVYPIEDGIKLSKTIRSAKLSNVFRSLPWKDWLLLLKKYREYIFFVTPGVVVTNLSNLLPIYFFSIVFSEKEVGYFAMASTIVSMPLSLIVNSSITVFLQKAAETINNAREDISRLVVTYYNRSFFVGLIPLVLIAISGRWIFLIVFGPEWEQAGVFVSFLCVAYSFNVVYGPLSVLFRLLNNEKVNFVTTIIFFGIRLFGLWIGVLYNDIIISIIGFSIASLLSQVTSLVIIFRMVQVSVWKLVQNLVIVSLFATLVIWLNRV